MCTNTVNRFDKISNLAVYCEENNDTFGVTYFVCLVVSRRVLKSGKAIITVQTHLNANRM